MSNHTHGPQSVSFDEPIEAILVDIDDEEPPSGAASPEPATAASSS